jgi:TctA family transporter
LNTVRMTILLAALAGLSYYFFPGNTHWLHVATFFAASIPLYLYLVNSAQPRQFLLICLICNTIDFSNLQVIWCDFCRGVTSTLIRQIR